MMNRVEATIKAVKSSEHLSFVELESMGYYFSAVLLETPEEAPYLKIGNRVWVVFKETEVAIAKNFSGQISLRNCIETTITKIDEKKLLSALTLDFGQNSIVSIISTKSCKDMDLKVSDRVSALIKSNEISIMQKDS